MYPRKTSILPLILLLLFLQVFSISESLRISQQQNGSITVIGTVFCDICSNNAFTRRSYFLPGAKVQVQCSFRPKSTPKEEIEIIVDRKTDRYGIYSLDIPPVDGFECHQGREMESFCRARLLESSSLKCNIPGLTTSSEHMALKFSQSNLCIYNLNALYYRPSKRDSIICGKPVGGGGGELGSGSNRFNSSLFFWPPHFPQFKSWHFPH